MAFRYSKTMGKYYGAVRVSTGTQVEKGYGLETQIAAITKYAKANKITVNQIFIDKGISGAANDLDDEPLSKRAGLLELLSVLKPGDSIIVLNTSRLWRSDTAKVLIRREIARRGALVISIEQPTYDIYSKDPNDRLLNGITELLDEYDRARIVFRLAGGRTTKANKGEKPAGRTPYGYRFDGKTKKIVVDPEEATTIDMIFSLANLNYSAREIARKLNEEGIRTRPTKEFAGGKEWGRQSILWILKNDFYAGKVTHQGNKIKGNHQPLISSIQFGKIQAKIQKRK